MNDPLEILAEDLAASHAAAARIAGRDPVGTRAVELARGRRWYLSAFMGPAFLCLTDAKTAEVDARRVRQVAAAVLLVEHVEEHLATSELDIVGAVARRLVGQTDVVELDPVLGELDEATRALGTWRQAPARAIASVPALDIAVRLHDVARAAYERFVTLTDPLVARQDELPGDLVESLRELESAANAAGLTRPLATVVGDALSVCDVDAGEMVLAHLTALVDAPESTPT